jgi:hypothetical protein
MASVFLSRLACILADLAAGFANDAGHCLSCILLNYPLGCVCMVS